MNDVVPWNAATFFGEPGKWELVSSDPNASEYCYITLKQDGSIAPHSIWQGMRRKKVKRTVGVWLNLYPEGDPAAYEHKRHADEYSAHHRLGGKAHYVEIEIEE